jgi:archaellin
MRAGADTIDAYLNDEVDIFALAQVGLIDGDDNGLLDPIDILFEGTAGVDMAQETINSLMGRYNRQNNNQISGYFTKTYLQEGTNHVDNNLQRGDIARFDFESARPVTEDEYIRLSLIPKIGTTTLTQFVTPEVMSVERVYLYP